jgi:hypothetical protein
MKKGFFLIMLFAMINADAQLSGHWLSDKSLLDCAAGDTIMIRKTKYKKGFYEWGGPCCGMQFEKAGDFIEYFTVMCSTESSPVVYSDERWQLEKETLLTISGSKRKIQLKIISRKAKKVSMIILTVS